VQLVAAGTEIDSRGVVGCQPGLLRS
jgi:hypothetical protein